MKILAPVNSFSLAELQIANGADEIYLGIDDEVFKSYSFTGRGKNSVHCQKVLPDYQEAKKICKLAREHQVKVNITANIPILSEGLPQMNLHNLYRDYVLKCMELQIDSLIVGDLGALQIIHDLNLNIPIHASTFFDTINRGQLEFLSQFGVKRAILSYHVTRDEIFSLVRQQLMEIEVIGFMSCSFFNGACNLTHEMGEVEQGEDVLIGVPCKALYQVSDGQESRQIPILDFELGCGLCSIQQLELGGVAAFKVVGRERKHEVIGQVVKLVRKLINQAPHLSEDEFIQLVQQEVPVWWKRLWCRNKRCKFTYHDKSLSRYYIGR
jgi:putative protease